MRPVRRSVSATDRSSERYWPTAAPQGTVSVRWCRRLCRVSCFWRNRAKHVMKLDTAAKGPFVSNHQTISRRKFLRGAGIVLSLPLLDAMMPVFGAVAKRLAADATPDGKPRRFFGICNNLGLL